MVETLSTTERYPGFPSLNHLEPSDFPKHTVIIMDGNRHWGEEHAGDKLAGHIEGARAGIKLMRAALPLPGEVLTFWGFAADNWRRDQAEVDHLMTLMLSTIQNNSQELIDREIRFIHLGRKDRIPTSLAETLKSLEDATLSSTGKILCAAIDYGGADHELRQFQHTTKTAVEIARAFPHMSPEEIAASVDKDWISKTRDGGGVIRPADLIIRPQHFRTSDVGWWNGPATELLFLPDVQFPDMTPHHLELGILQYAKDKQNLGK